MFLALILAMRWWKRPCLVAAIAAVLALVAGAYWGTDAYGATKPKIHCYVFRFAEVPGAGLVQLDAKPYLELKPCPPAGRSRRA